MRKNGTGKNIIIYDFLGVNKDEAQKGQTTRKPTEE
jgi:hypothetical protein